MVSVKFNDQHIPDSPFKVHVAPATGDVQKLRVENLGEQSLQVCLITVSWAVRSIGEIRHKVPNPSKSFFTYILLLFIKAYIRACGLCTLFQICYGIQL